MTSTRTLAFLAFGQVFALGLAAQMSPLAYEGFDGYPDDYPDDTAFTKEGSPFALFEPQNDGLFNIEPGDGLEYDRLPTTPGLLNLSSGGTKMTADLDLSPEGPFSTYLNEEGLIGKDGTTLYVSFLYKVTDPASQQSFAQFYDSRTETEPFNGTNFGVGYSWGANLPFAFRGLPGNPELHAQDGETHFVVIKIAYKDGPDDITVWSDPPLSATEAEAPPTVGPASRDATFDGFYFMSQGTSGNNLLSFFDELRFADTWAGALANVPFEPPASPSALTGKGTSESEILLQWQDPVLNEEGFLLERAADPDGPWTEVTQTAAGVTSYLDSGLDPDTAYAYRVSAFNDNGVSEATGPVTVSTLGSGESLPPPPTGQAGELDGLKPVLSWTDVATDEFAYRIYRALDDGEFVLIGEIDDGSEGFTDTGAPTGSLLRYRIVSVNEFGESLVEEILTLDAIEEPFSGPSWVWIEGEDFVSSTWPNRNTWIEPGNPDEVAAASGGDLFGDIVDDEALSTDEDWINAYTFTAPSNGTYALYNRQLFKYGPFKWRLNGGEWLDAPSHELAILEESPYRQFFPLTWQKVDAVVELEGGTQYTLEVKVNLAQDFPEASERAKKNYGFDAFLFTTLPFSPAGKAKPGVKFATAEEGFWPFEPDQDTYEQESPIDLRHLNEDLAGESGWVERRGDDYVLGSGEPVRFAGVVTGSGSYSTYGAQARFLAKRGVNAARWHKSIDDRSPDSDSILNVNEDAIKEAQQHVAAFKEAGIYSNISSFFILGFRVREQWNIPGYDAAFIEANDRAPFGIFFWNETFKEAYKAWIAELLTRPNPWDADNTPLAEETAVMNFEILNEDNLFFFTFLPTNYPDEQLEILEKRFGNWIMDRYGSIEAAYTAWGGGERGRDDIEAGRMEMESAAALRGGSNPRRLRQRDQLRFMTEAQKGFWEEIVDHVRGLGYQGPVSPTNWRTANDLLLRDVEYYTYTATDVIDIHNYFSAKASTELSYAVSVGDTYANVSAVDRPEEISSAFEQVENRASMVSEFVWTNPNDVAAESPLLSLGYASLQDVDALFWFAHASVGFDTVLKRWQPGRPATMGQFPGVNLLYRRGDIAEAPVSVREGRSLESLMSLEESIIVQGAGFDPTRDDLYDPEQGTGKLGMEAALVGKVEVAFGDSDRDFVHPDLPLLQDEADGYIRSITGEAELDRNRGVFTFDSPRSQGATSYLGGAGPVELSDAIVEVGNPFGAVLVISLDGRPIAESGEVLIQAASMDQPYGFATEPAVLPGGLDAHTILDKGTVPFNIQNIDGQVTLKGFAGASATYLDANGYPVARPVQGDDGDDLIVTLPFNALYTVVTREPTDASAPYIHTGEAATGIVGQPYSFTLDGSSPAGPVSWAAMGPLPEGLTLDADGRLHGIPSEEGMFTFPVEAGDGTATTSAEINLRVISMEEPGGIVLEPDSWMEHPELGWIYGYTGSIGYGINLGAIYTADAPWIYHYTFGWLYYHSTIGSTLYFYSPEKGWILRAFDSPWFTYQAGGEWVWDNFLIPQS